MEEGVVTMTKETMTKGAASKYSPKAAPTWGGVYFLAMIGAWVWFWQQHDGFWWHVLAILKGIVWPSFLMYEVFEALR